MISGVRHLVLNPSYIPSSFQLKTNISATVYHTIHFQASKLVLLPGMHFPSLPGKLLHILQNPILVSSSGLPPLKTLLPLSPTGCSIGTEFSTTVFGYIILRPTSPWVSGGKGEHCIRICLMVQQWRNWASKKERSGGRGKRQTGVHRTAAPSPSTTL